ncbi:hypothetical protein CYY_007303 [Polysphondylium violaceum]|uniref:BPL/LPL catalytic domain-containing protein n=1 Tax=Polysphondylium violaceum TaxID=133409 RepID=A0A8J4V2C4_9MYCE|nr:hypothetical protein CYY_007303 [Polysphondylium violaceum]
MFYHHTLPLPIDNNPFDFGQHPYSIFGRNNFWYYYSRNGIDIKDLFDPSKKPKVYDNPDHVTQPSDDSVPIVVGDNIPKDPTKFDFTCYFKILKTHLLGQNIMMNLELKNDVYLCLQLLSMTQQGLTILADQQQQQTDSTTTINSPDKQFICPLGSLVFSFKLQKVDSDLKHHLQKLLAIAMVDSISTRTAVQSQKVDIKVKFVKGSISQDIYANNQKIGGILTEYSENDDRFDVNLGAGINVHDSTFSLNRITGGSPTNLIVGREDILANFFNNFESMYFTLIHKGLEPFKERLSQISI